MKNRQSGQIFRAMLCVLVSIFGIIFTFCGGNETKEVNETKSEKTKTGSSIYEHAQENLQQKNNESEPETYMEGREVKVYFTNTEKLDASSFPLAAHDVLCSETQKYLDAFGYENVKEIRIQDNGFVDDEKSVTFQCKLPGHEETLVVSYKKDKSTLEFETVIIERINEGT